MEIRPLLAAVLVATTIGVAPASASNTLASSSTPLAGYRIQSTARTGDSGATISQPGYPTTGWVNAAPRSTVLAALLANGQYSDPFFSNNLASIPTSEFTVPWWYRSEFTLASEPGARTYLDFSGVISKADVFVNGTQVANATQVAGAYTHHELDITNLVQTGTNAVAFRIQPNNASSNLTIGWIDWLQNPPDRNMGIFRDVNVRRNGGVALRGGHVLISLNGALTQATLTAKVDARNDTGSAVTQTISGTVAGIAISANVSLAAGEKKTVTFPAVTLNNPQVWWPAGWGGQPLYDLNLSSPTDAVRERFGVRSVTGALDANGHRQYRINGRPILIKGGGWSPDVFLRWDSTYVEDRIRYTLDLGLNTIRLEGHLEPDEFFDMTDRLGMLVMPGWECCNKWEAGGWSSADFAIARASMTGEAERLRNHPSVFTFLIGSDIAPPASKETPYVQALQAADWQTPIVPVASDNSSPMLGSSGMKMPGPYDWVPPNYWYNKREGGAFGFNSETSAGPDVPTLDTLRRMMTTSELNTLWQNPSATQYHRSPSSTFDDLTIFNNAIIGRYGTATSLDDYVRKAQLAQYENVRSQFEAYGRNFTDSSNPATGVIYWMLNSGWTSLHWQLFDRYLDQNGAYFGAKKANEPLHIQYSLDNRSVVVVNSRPAAASNLTARINVYNLDGTQKYSFESVVNVGGYGAKTNVVTVPALTGLSTAYFVKLTLTEGGQEVSRNVYWLSTSNDVINWAGNTWYYVPTSSYANLKSLATMPSSTVGATASTTSAGPTSTTTVTLTNNSSAMAFQVDAHVVKANGTPALPIQWNDNRVSLWPGESVTLTASYRTADLQGSAPSVRVAGFNVPTFTVPAGPGVPDTQPPSTPGNLRTTSVTSSSVALAWDASTDNVGVSGYDVFRDGAPRGTSAGTSFTDSVSPATSYTYTVRARDAAGNTSGQSSALPVTTPSGPARLEAENATISQGVVESNHAGFSGTGFVNYDNVAGSYVEFAVTGPATALSIRYANGTTANRPMTVNGVTVDFPGTGAWTTWTTKTVPISLGAGTHLVRLTATTANGGPNLDFVETATAPEPPSRMEAEDALLSQCLVESNHAGFSGTGFVNCDNVIGSYVQFGVTAAQAGSATLTVRYANGTTANRPAEVNGERECGRGQPGLQPDRSLDDLGERDPHGQPHRGGEHDSPHRDERLRPGEPSTTSRSARGGDGSSCEPTHSLIRITPGNGPVTYRAQAEPMTLWRVRATVDDRPGFLAVLTASLALRSINILAVQVHTTETGAVDDFLLDAPDALDEEDLLAAIERGRGRNAWVTRADAYDLIDPPSQMASLAARVTADPSRLASALSTLLGGCLVQHERETIPPGHGMTAMRVPDPVGGGMIVLSRLAPTFTPAEFARAQGLVEVARASLARQLSNAAVVLADGSELTIRQAVEADVAQLVEMHGRCGERSLFRRYLAGTRGPTTLQLSRLISPARGAAVVAEDSAGKLIALANLVGEGEVAEAALLVEDGWQRRGIGTGLLRRLLALARPAGFRAVVLHTHADNEPMLRMVHRMPQPAHFDVDSGIISATLSLVILSGTAGVATPS